MMHCNSFTSKVSSNLLKAGDYLTKFSFLLKSATIEEAKAKEKNCVLYKCTADACVVGRESTNI